MSSFSRQKSIVPRNGRTLVVGIVARISGCADQKEVSLDDQVDHAKETVADLPYEGPVEYQIIQTKGKGERLDRPELAEVEAMLRSGKLDFLILDDIGRLVRGAEASWLCGIAVDHGTRVIAINDCIDTNDDSWDQDVLAACSENVGHNALTSKRIKQKLMNRFKKGIGATSREIAGYVKPPGAKTFSDWMKVDEATPIIQEGLKKLRDTLNCSLVGDWFNAQNFATGKYSRAKVWDGTSVRRFYKNTLLIGLVGRGFRHTVKHNETGRRISVKNPNGPTIIEVPHLAHVERSEFEELNRLLDAQNKRLGRKPVKGNDPLQGRPRKRTRFPGQQLVCGICGRTLVYGGHGLADHLVCQGSRDYKCWNTVGVNGPLAAQKLTAAVMTGIQQIPDFEPALREMLQQELDEFGVGRERRLHELEHLIDVNGRDTANIVKALRELGTSPTLLNELQRLEEELANLSRDLDCLKNAPRIVPELPSINLLRKLARDRVAELVQNSVEAAAAIRKLIPKIIVFPVRLCDGGHIYQRAKFTLNLSPLLQIDKALVVQSLQHELVVDLFDGPQREVFRTQVVALRAAGWEQRAIGKKLRITQPAVQNALALQRKMDQLGIEDPYVRVLSPPEDYKKLRMHKHPRYRFTPLDGFPQM
jgi:DNA invertase Pin-like site-specific DNA recombinase